MKSETLVWLILFVGGAGFLTYRAALTERGVGRQYVVADQLEGKYVAAENVTVPLAEGETVDPSNELKSVRYQAAANGDDRAIQSPTRTVGVWIAALLTLCVFSYLYRDNAFYKLAESIIVGVSAGYWIVLSFWTVLIDKILLKLAPDVARYSFLPDAPVDARPDYMYVVPVVLGCLIFFRLSEKYSWLGRWPLAFVVGTTAGLKLVLFLNADFVQQIRSTILPLVVYTMNESGRLVDWKESIQNTVLVVSVLSSLTYFYFSIEHTGVIGKISRLGIWVLMISFGASFALTVMGRITLLTMRLQFLFDDWLGLVSQ